jgi:hypothetical protein
MSFAAQTYTGAWRGRNGSKLCLLDTEPALLTAMSLQVKQNMDDIASIEVGAVGSGTITDDMLATDVKAGSLAALTTAVKTSLQAAINEVDAHADTAQAAADALELIVGSTSLTTTAQTVTAAINELDAANSGMATLTGTQVFTNKTLTSPVLNTPKIGDGDTGCTVTSADQTHASATVTIPNFTDAADEFVLKDTEQILTLKTFTLPKIATGGAICDAGGDEYVVFTEAVTPVTYIGLTSGNTTVRPQVRGAGETNTGLLLAGTGTGNVVVGDGADITKIVEFSAVGATTGKKTTLTFVHTDDRAITFPNFNGTLATIAGIETFTNKSLTTPLITDGDTGVTVTSANQTHAAPTVTIPDIVDAADTFCMVDTVQVLTNKSITEPQFTYTLSAHDYVAGAADWTLSASELLKYVHKPTNANAPVNAIVSTAIREYMFINSTGQALTVKTAAGTGISIANTKVAKVFCDGVNVIRITADA